MGEGEKAKLQTNIANSLKFYSVRFNVIFSAAVSALGAWFLTLPEDCAGIAGCTYSQTSVLAKLGVGVALVPLVAAAINWWFRVKPQLNLTPREAAAKSARGPETEPSSYSGE